MNTFLDSSIATDDFIREFRVSGVPIMNDLSVAASTANLSRAGKCLSRAQGHEIISDLASATFPHGKDPPSPPACVRACRKGTYARVVMRARECTSGDARDCPCARFVARAQPRSSARQADFSACLARSCNANCSPFTAMHDPERVPPFGQPPLPVSNGKS